MKGALMRSKNLILAAAITVGGMGYCMNVHADDGAKTTGNVVDNAADKTEDAGTRAGDAIRRTADRLTTGSTTQPGVDTAMAPDAKDIRETLKEVTQAAVTKGGFDDLIERFVDADRTRLNKDSFTKQDHSVLDGRIAQFQKDWQAKYNQSFKVPNKNIVYDESFAMVEQRQNTDAARLASEHQTNVTDNQTPVKTDESVQPGRSVATVTIAASHGLPPLMVPMVHEFPDRWKIDVPDNYTAEQLHDAVLNQLTKLDEHKDQWPADVNEAYRAVTHHILMAVLNQTIGADTMHENNSDLNR
jgi:hypothetical protein